MRRSWLMLLLLAMACGKPVGRIQFKGKSRPVSATAEQLQTFAGRKVPEGYVILGVISAQCATLDGSSGLVEAPCSKFSMTQRAKQRAAAAGGTALLDVACREDMTDRRLQRRNNQTGAGRSGANMTVRTLIGCRATVLRRERGQASSAQKTAPSLDGKKEQIAIGGVPVTIRTARVAKLEGRASPGVNANDVGEVSEPPPGTHTIAHVAAQCDRGCARNTARRALRMAAARVGATLLSAMHCQLEGDAWRCRAAALALAPAAPSSSASAPSAASASPPPAASGETPAVSASPTGSAAPQSAAVPKR